MTLPRTFATPPLTLARQESDFTAEGSPPPGKVATGAPLAAAPPARSGSATRLRGTITLKRPAQARSR